MPEQNENSPGRPEGRNRNKRQREKIILAVSLVLFVLTLAFPLTMIYRHQGASFALNVEDMGNAILLPYQAIAKGKSFSSDKKKMALALFAIPVLLAARYLPGRKKYLQWMLLGLLLALCVLAFKSESYSRFLKFTKGKYIQTWNVYHYYFGSKYFNEMGYFHHYAYTFKAADEGAFEMGDVTKANDLYSYKIIRKEKVLEQIEGREDFSEKRWRRFKKEIGFFDKFARKGLWREMLKDHGYNATPFWNTIGAFLGNNFPITKRKSRTFVLGIDMVLLLVTFSLVGWAFGARWGLFSALFFLVMFVNRYYTVAGYIRYDWFCTTVIGLCFFHKKHYKTAAPFFAYAAMTRIFPAIFLFGPGIKWLVDWVRTRTMDRKLFSMFVVFALCCVLFFGLGCLNKKGLGSWSQFFQNIRHHTARHYLGPMRIGLKHAFIDDFSTPKISRDRKREAFAKQTDIYHAIKAVMIALFLLVIWRRNRTDAFILGLMLIFSVLVLSRYYWALLGMLFLLTQYEDTRWRNALSDLYLMIMIVAWYTFKFHEPRGFSYYMPPTFFLMGYFIFLSGSYLVEDGFWLADWIRNRKTGDLKSKRFADTSE